MKVGIAKVRLLPLQGSFLEMQKSISSGNKKRVQNRQIDGKNGRENKKERKRERKRKRKKEGSREGRKLRKRKKERQTEERPKATKPNKREQTRTKLIYRHVKLSSFVILNLSRFSG